MLRFGILSTARIARDQVVPGILDAENCIVTAVASRDLERARGFAARFAIPHAFGSYEELLASPEVDAVYIALPTAQHVEWTLRCAEAGKHVLCEKPIALRAGEIDALIAARDKTGRLISEAYMVAYAPVWAKTHELLAAGAIGRLRRIEGAFTYFNKDPANVRNVAELGGGALFDVGGYPMTTARLATGREPKRVRARIERDPTFGTDIFASVEADFGPFSLSFYVSTQMARRESMVFLGEEGIIELRAPFTGVRVGAEQLELRSRAGERSEVFHFQESRQYRRQVEAFAAKALGGAADVLPLESSQGTQRAIDAIFRAGEAGGWEPV
jgi:predicted dehydrogenase